MPPCVAACAAAAASCRRIGRLFAAGVVAHTTWLAPSTPAAPAVQIWRLVTPFVFFGKFSLGFIFQVYLLINYCLRLETNPYPSGGGTHLGTVADFVWMLVLGMAQLLLMGWIMGVPFLGSSLVFMILYVWANRNPNDVARMPFFGFQFKAVYLPWVMLAFGVLLGNSPVFDLMGIAAGHVYYFLQEVLPASTGFMGGKTFLYTPLFLSNLMGTVPSHLNAVQRMGGGMAAAAGGAARGGAGHQWGRGNVLGG